MASSDYKLCDLCGAKTFYDANIEDERYRQTWGARSAYDPIGLKVICGTCNKTHDVIIVPRIATPAPLSDPRVKALVELLREANADLKSYVDADWPERMRNQYPDMRRRWKRDMELCHRIDAALRAIEGEP